jgi:ornithine cyclodeaminase
MREGTDDLFADAVVVVDTPTALREAGDLLGPIAAGQLREETVRLLCDVRGPVDIGRAGISIFKSVGYAAEDLVAVDLLLDQLGKNGGKNETVGT